MASGVVTRIPVKTNQAKKVAVRKSNDEADHMLGIGADEVEDYKRPRYKLLSLLYSKPGTHVRKLTEVLMRLDNLSHILVWTLDPRAEDAEAQQIKRNREAAATRKAAEAAAAAAAQNPSNTANSGGGGSKEPVDAAAAGGGAPAAGGNLAEQHDDDEGYVRAGFPFSGTATAAQKLY
jgi:hypothetical protein